jgi:hypothetical protein
MLLVVVPLSLVAGIGASYAASYVPAYAEAFEKAGGFLMVAALLLAGAALPA